MGNQLSVSKPFLKTLALVTCSNSLVLETKLSKTSSVKFHSGKSIEFTLPISPIYISSKLPSPFF